MPAITVGYRRVYRSPTKRRDYLTREAAVNAEARALMVKRYPTEKGGADDGYSHWHFTDDDDKRKAFVRLRNRIRNGSQTNAPINLGRWPFVTQDTGRRAK